MSRQRIAFVIQRYGKGITGGSESLARELAERLSDEYEVTVFASCARDYVTWRNELAEGEEQQGGVTVHRFPVEEERDLAAFNAFAEPLYERAESSQEDGHEFLRRQGPHVPRLVEELERRRDEFVATLFFTYLYYPTYWGLKAVPERSILVPTTHDEPALRLGIFDELFALPRALAFLTPPEGELVERRFGIGERPHQVAGFGIEASEAPDVEAFRIHRDLSEPYALYAGRIDGGKGCAEMLDHYQHYRYHFKGAATLVLIGRLAMTLPKQPGVRYLGFLPEEEKLAAMAGAQAVICPSPFESLSITLLEGLAQGTPSLVNALSPVLDDHVRRSNAGLVYANADEFAEGLDLLVKLMPLRRALGRNGRGYVDEHYRWDKVLDRYRFLIDAVANG